ncbi:MAG: hypothetical protein A4E45_00765 [Methanosaeta sp. PtaB.Bin039]|nr:MAG: hypothetical protein A4E45_00765 [Methanosaeta sp. PtaB.Bin039]OPY47752.1 MAG: hypothetical protein A4E47_00137 [Methanosaeta sp. PtaU1.Bin028]HOT07730.1 NAD(P)H-dependent oxidoreductase [Methanotrichaceae archaeon]HQF17414.1 NAD(P)H-dependent oxidoreductase [Methanotrichaceae archaeon]HQI92172.1 NAD(P)H-dependent oxidoreductase [Methanotrichaceae archaeon]
MKISLILANPNLRSFNHAIAGAAADALQDNGHLVAFHDLYLEGFDPLLRSTEIPRGALLEPSIETHCREIASAQGIIIVHPNWWGMPPAVLTGWVDRIMRPGLAYEFLEGDSGEGVPRGLLQARSALVFNTSNTFVEREQQVFGDPLESIWKNCIFGLCGVEEFYRRTFSVVVTSTSEQRREWLEEVRETVDSVFPAERRGAMRFIGSSRQSIMHD